MEEHGDETSGDIVSHGDSVVPHGWIEPLPDALTPSQYLTKLLAATQAKSRPTREQLQFLAVFVAMLDIVKLEEYEGTP